jgi:hypothetical protein
MDKITFFNQKVKEVKRNKKHKETDSIITYELPETLYNDINKEVINKYTEISDILTKRNTHNNTVLKQRDLLDTSAKSPAINLTGNNNIMPALKTNNGIPGFCTEMNKLFDLSIQNSFEQKHTGANPLKLPPDLPIIKKGIKIKMIGRMHTIMNKTKYNTTRFSYLNLPEYQKKIEWSPSINDAFILCGYQSALDNYNSNVDMKGTPSGIQSGFTLVLVVNKKHNNISNFLIESNKAVPISKDENCNQHPPTVNPDSSITHDELICKTDTNCNKEHIFPPTKDYTSDTPGKCATAPDKAACYATLPSVTFTEIVLLTKYFNMDCYLLKRKNINLNLYFFCIKDSMKEMVIKYNKKKCSRNGEPMSDYLFHVKVLSEHTASEIKYLKYKNKYLQLKKSILENTY